MAEAALSRSSWIFDCDGVLIDSNRIKTAAFETVSLRYGTEIADDVVHHHLANGGVSRHVKFRRIFDELLGRPPHQGEYEQLLQEFAQLIRKALLTAAVDPAAVGLLRLIKAANARTSVVSGGLEDEVRWILNERRLAPYFDEILGSPTDKHQHVGRLVGAMDRTNDAVLVGDSREDLRVALEFGLRPVFVSHWSEFSDWQAFLIQHPDVVRVYSLAQLMDLVECGAFP